MGCVHIEEIFLVLSLVVLIVLIACFINELKTKVEFQGFYPFLLMLFGCIFFYCLGSFFGFYLEIYEPTIVSNSSKDIGMAGLSIFAIGGSFLSSNIFGYLEKMNQMRSLPRYLFRVLVITDFITWSVIFGIAISFTLVILAIESMTILLSFIFVLILLIVILLIYIYRIYLQKEFYINEEDMFKKIYKDMDKNITVYNKYYDSGFFRDYIDNVVSRNIEPNEIMKEHIINYISKLKNFSSKILKKIGLYEKNMEYELFDKYYYDLSRIIVSTIDAKNDSYWVINYIGEVINSEIRTIANTNHFFLEMSAYRKLIDTLQARYDRLSNYICFNNNFDNQTIRLIEEMKYQSLISIANDGEFEIKKITFSLALVGVLITRITTLFCNDMFSESQDQTNAFNNIKSYSNYLKDYLITKYGSFSLGNVYSLLVFIIGIYALVVNSRQFISLDQKIDEDKLYEIKDSYVKHYTSMLEESINDIIIKLDGSLDEIDANLFNSFYCWNLFEDVSFKFIAGLLVVIDIKTEKDTKEKKKQFELLVVSKMRNIKISKKNIEDAIDRTKNTWVYSDDMKKILNEFLNNNKQ